MAAYPPPPPYWPLWAWIVAGSLCLVTCGFRPPLPTCQLKPKNSIPKGCSTAVLGSDGLWHCTGTDIVWNPATGEVRHTGAPPG